MRHKLGDKCTFVVNTKGLIYCEPHKRLVTAGMSKAAKDAMWSKNWDEHRAHGLVPVAFRHALYVASRCSQHNVLCLDAEQ